jgi:hypothetical protein
MGALKHYRFDAVVTPIVIIAVAIFMGPAAILPLLLLLILEIALSFDNAVVNARVLIRMSHFWRMIFITVGILVAVVFMRFVFPIVVVAVPSDLSWLEVINLALNDAVAYEHELHEVHHIIMMLGGVFLAMIFWNYFFEERERFWITILEKPLAQVSNLKAAQASINYVSTGIVAVSIVAVSFFYGLSHGADGRNSLLITGFVALALFTVVNGVSTYLEKKDEEREEEESRGGAIKLATGRAAFMLFLYLEVQDAAFSFDGVSGAFAITNNIVLIAAGLGIGALFVRSMTIHLVESGHLKTFRYLEHGAHWAIGALALCLLISIFVEVNELFTGGIGAAFIIASVIGSIIANRRDRKLGIEIEEAHVGAPYYGSHVPDPEIGSVRKDEVLPGS